MQSLYFAYGSNLDSARMLGRVASARVRGRAWLRGYRLTLDKRGHDGTAKANLTPAPEGGVWGVVYRLDDVHWADLDACEGGYERVRVEVALDGGERLVAATYRSQRLTDHPVPSRAYKAFLVRGAREHGLPPEWVALLEALPERG